MRPETRVRGSFLCWVGRHACFANNSEPMACPRPMAHTIVYLAGSFSGGAASELWLMGAQGEDPRKVLTAPEGYFLTLAGLVPRQPADCLPAIPPQRDFHREL